MARILYNMGLVYRKMNVIDKVGIVEVFEYLGKIILHFGLLVDIE